MRQLAIPVPESGPLRANLHPIVAENGVHVPDGIVERDARSERSVHRVQSVGKGELAEFCFRIGGSGAQELDFYHQRHMRGGRIGRRVRYERSKSDGWRQGDGGGQRDGRGEGNGRGMRERFCGGIETVDDRFGLAIKEESQNPQHERPNEQSPAAQDPFTAHTEEGQSARLPDGVDPHPDAEEHNDDRNPKGGADCGMNVKGHVQTRLDYEAYQYPQWRLPRDRRGAAGQPQPGCRS